ncbi:hypothetical protein [Kribbella sp. CA-294648]|uniref:hypothetical protein n=1 Tax=Kribbella sp. CA-294648 TaxID=3239948 RepID=UPI003D934F51
MNVDRWIGLAGLLASIVGIPLAVVLARRGRQRPKLRTAEDFDILMSPEQGIAREALSIAYKDRSIERVSRTNIAIWNEKGGDTINGTDTLTHDPLRIQVEGDDDAILQVQLLAVSREQCQIAPELDPDDPTKVLLKFDFLDAGDGAVFEVLHVGDQAATVTGTIRGATLSGKTKTVLTPPSLNVIAVRPIFKRVWHLLRGNDVHPGSSRFRPIFALAFILSTVVASAVVVVLLALMQFKNPELVDISQFDVTSTSGQAELAEEIRKGNTLPRERVLSLLFIFPVGLFVYTARQTWRDQFGSPIPSSIVARRLYGPVEGENQISSPD